jgi:hypothetical protein
VSFEVSNGTPCFIECKRVHSQQKLGDRIRQAAYQIRRRCDDSSNPGACGIVAVDISKLLNPGDHLFDAPTRDGLSVEAERMLESYHDADEKLALQKRARELIQKQQLEAPAHNRRLS